MLTLAIPYLTLLFWTTYQTHCDRIVLNSGSTE